MTDADILQEIIAFIGKQANMHANNNSKDIVEKQLSF